MSGVCYKRRDVELRALRMGELDDLAKQATALAARVTRIESLTGTIVDRPMQHCAWRSKQGAGGGLFKSATGRGPEVRTPVTALASAGGDLFKYRPDQARDERGRFADEGKGGGLNARLGRSERPDTPKRLRVAPRLIVEKGAGAIGVAIRQALTDVPRTHYNLLRLIRMKAIRDTGALASQMGINMEEGSGVAGGFRPVHGVTVGTHFNGVRLRSDPYHTALHELAHALDYEINFNVDWSLSKELAPIAMEEFSKLSKAQRWYAEVYDPSDMPSELFAEAYSAIYARKPAREYLGAMTHRQFMRAFPKTIEKVKSFATREWTDG